MTTSIIGTPEENLHHYILSEIKGAIRQNKKQKQKQKQKQKRNPMCDGLSSVEMSCSAHAIHLFC